MDEQRARVFDDLRGLLEGDLDFEDLPRAPFRYDAGPFEQDALGVVAPRSEGDLCALVQYAAERGVPLHARGGGTDESGGCLGPGLVVDLSRHFRRLTIQGGLVVVQAGAVLDRVNAALAPMRQRVALDSLHSEAATIGGLIASDAIGPRSLEHGSMGQQVQLLRGVFANGEPGTLHHGFRPSDADDPPSHVEQVGRRISSLVARHSQRLSRQRARPLGQSGGYRLEALRNPSGIDLATLVAGSFGSVMIITEATLRTVSIPAACSVVVAHFARLADAAEAVPLCVSARASCCELYDGRSISLARDADAWLREAFPEPCEAVLLTGFEGDDAGAVADRARRLSDRLSTRALLAHEPVELHGRDQARHVIALRPVIDERLLRGKGTQHPISPWARLIVPIGELPSFMVRLQDLLKRTGVAAMLDAHAGLGVVRLRPLLDLNDPADRDRVYPLADAVRELVCELGGVASAGPAPQRSTWLRRFQGELVNLHREIKYAFDPLGLLNPGVVAASEGPETASRLRPMPSRSAVDSLVETAQADTMVLRWPERSRVEHLAACGNCGQCRSQEPTLRMCPVFRSSQHEPASPRGKVNLLRQIAAGALDPRLWGSQQFRDHAELCVHCKLCEVECPGGVDVSGLMLEAKAAYVANHGLTPEDWMLSRIDLWSSWASRMPHLFNPLMRNRFARWLIERAFGLSQFRNLPLAPGRSFVKRAERLGLTRPRPHEPGPRAVYFLDIFANHFDPELAESTVAVYRHLGVNVFVPPRQRGCGMPALVTGDLDRARELLLVNLRILGDAVRDGYTVICSEPTALLVLKRESFRLTEDLDAELVAKNSMDACQYLAGLLSRGNVPRPVTPVAARVGYHQPCHLRALGVGTPGLDLMRAIPGLEAEWIDRGCSGMAGIYGLSARHFRSSLRAGRPMLRRLRDADLQVGATECSACRMQMEQGTAKRTIHPMKILALAYGLNPSLRRHVTEPKPKRVVS